MMQGEWGTEDYVKADENSDEEIQMKSVQCCSTWNNVDLKRAHNMNAQRKP
jgi:hypothetical protein